MWEKHIEDFRQYLKLERGLTDNSVMAYTRDLRKLTECLTEMGKADIEPKDVTPQDFSEFVSWLGRKKVAERTQSRIMSGVRTFYKSLIISEEIEADPTESVQAPRIGRKLPTVLSVAEIDAMEETFAKDTMDGVRNLAMIEVLYSCGLRVSELTNLRLINLRFSKGYITVVGKGRKERMIPIGERAKNCVLRYLREFRETVDILPAYRDYVFINKLGTTISRIMVFNIVREAAQAAGITKHVSPHTLRHSFATHLVDGGANLRAVQQMLGHESIVTTEIYTHLDNTYLKTTLLDHHPYKGDK